MTYYANLYASGDCGIMCDSRDEADWAYITCKRRFDDHDARVAVVRITRKRGRK